MTLRKTWALIAGVHIALSLLAVLGYACLGTAHISPTLHVTVAAYPELLVGYSKVVWFPMVTILGTSGVHCPLPISYIGLLCNSALCAYVIALGLETVRRRRAHQHSR